MHVVAERIGPVPKSTHHRSRATTPYRGRSLQLHRRIQSRASWLRPHGPHPLVAPHRAAPPSSVYATDHLSRQGEDAPRPQTGGGEGNENGASSRPPTIEGWVSPQGVDGVGHTSARKPPSLFRFQTRIRAGPRSMDRSGATRPAQRPPHERGHARSLRKTVAKPARWKGVVWPLYGVAPCRWSQTSSSISRSKRPARPSSARP